MKKHNTPGVGFVWGCGGRSNIHLLMEINMFRGENSLVKFWGVHRQTHTCACTETHTHILKHTHTHTHNQHHQQNTRSRESFQPFSLFTRFTILLLLKLFGEVFHCGCDKDRRKVNKSAALPQCFVTGALTAPRLTLMSSRRDLAYVTSTANADSSRQELSEAESTAAKTTTSLHEACFSRLT